MRAVGYFWCAAAVFALSIAVIKKAIPTLVITTSVGFTGVSQRLLFNICWKSCCAVVVRWDCSSCAGLTVFRGLAQASANYTCALDGDLYGPRKAAVQQARMNLSRQELRKVSWPCGASLCKSAFGVNISVAWMFPPWKNCEIKEDSYRSVLNQETKGILSLESFRVHWWESSLLGTLS